MRPITAGEVPFTTTNAALAFCLYMAGVEFQDERQPCFNFYDADILKGMGYAGMALDDATKAAFESGQKGHVQYAFRHPNELQRLLKAFSEQEREIKEGEGTAQAVQLKIIKRFQAGEIDEHEMLLRTACVNLKMRGPFMSLWKQRPPLIRIPKGGKPKSQQWSGNRNGKHVEGTAVQMPGFKIVSLNASDEIKRHLKV